MENQQWGVISAIIVGAGTFVAGCSKVVMELKKQRHEHDKETAKEKHEEDNVVIKELHTFIEMQTKAVEGIREENHKLRNEMQLLNSKVILLNAAFVQAETWIVMLEERLKQDNIPFPAWKSPRIEDS